MHGPIELVDLVRGSANSQRRLDVLGPALADVDSLADIHLPCSVLLNHIDAGFLVGFQSLSEILKRTLVVFGPDKFVNCIAPSQLWAKFS